MEATKQTKHTPGPWIAHFHEGDGEWFVKSTADGLPHGGHIASFGYSQTWPAEAEGNARLIAAAPELAEALMDLATAVISGGPFAECVTAARAALKKAGVL